MHVVGDADEEADPDFVALLGPGEGPNDDLVQHGTGTEQGTAVERPAGHLDQGSSFGDEAESSAHTLGRRKNGPESDSPQNRLGLQGGVDKPFRHFRTGDLCPVPGRCCNELGGTPRRTCSAPDVLCATYPVWENRATGQGRKIGLNIVILPALGPDKQPDPVFEFGGGPGQGIVESAGGLALSSLRQKRDYVLVDQRGTGRSNPLNCNLYGNP